MLPSNRLESVTVSRLDNASVDVGGGPANAPVNVVIPLAASQQPLILTVRRLAPGAFTARLIVKDACGEWPTLVGGGPGVP